jgi:hypothetical protein
MQVSSSEREDTMLMYSGCVHEQWPCLYAGQFYGMYSYCRYCSHGCHKSMLYISAES